MDYLYLLQQWREGALSFLTPFFLLFSEVGILIAPLVAAVFYWSVDKNLGVRALFSFGAGQLSASFIKQTACIYRPWVRDSRLHLADGAADMAADYSFPSGHVTCVATICGTLASHYRRKKWVLILCTVLTLLMMFARNFLGAHTFIDVVAGLVLSVIVTGLTGLLINYVDRHPEKDILVAAAGIVISIAFILYILFKPYPMEYDANGQLLADPMLMRADAFGSAGIVMGILIGWLLERRFIRFSVEGTVCRRILRAVIGVAIFVLLYSVILKKLVAGIDPGLGKFIRYFVSMLAGIAGYPAVIKQIQKKK